MAVKLVYDNRTEPFTLESLYAVSAGTKFVVYYAGQRRKDRFRVVITKDLSGGFAVVQVCHDGGKVRITPSCKNVLAMINGAIARQNGYRLCRWE